MSLLTDAEIIALRDELLPSQGESFDCIAFARVIERVVAGAREWQPIETAPMDGGIEVLLRVKMRAGIRGRCLVGHHMGGGHCIEGHPPIARGWYFWNGRMFDEASEPTHWMPLPESP